MFTILNILLVALVVIVIDLVHYYHSTKQGVGPLSLRIAAVTTAIIAGVIGAAVLFYLNAA